MIEDKELKDNQFRLPQDAIEELRTEFISIGGIVDELPEMGTVRDFTQVHIPKTDADGKEMYDRYQAINGKWFLLPDVAQHHLHAEGSSEQYETDQLITITLADAIYPVVDGWTNHYLHNMGNGTGIFKMKIAGDYHIGWTLAFHSTGANQNYGCGLLVNDINVEIAWSHTHTQATGDIAMMGAGTIYRLREGDRISIGIKNIGGTANVIIDHASFSVFRLR